MTNTRTGGRYCTLEEYLDAFLDAGLRLVKLADVLQPFALQAPVSRDGHPFPFFMVLAFARDE